MATLRNRHFRKAAFISLLFTGSFAFPACEDEFSSCTERRDCPVGGRPSDIDGGAAGQGGEPAAHGGAGGSHAAGTTGDAGAGGTVAVSAGAGGEGGDGEATAAGGNSGGTSTGGAHGEAGGSVGGTGTGGMNSDGTAVGTLNQPCASEGATACQGHLQKLQLLCSGGKWTALASCSGNNNCDTSPGQSAGSCQSIVAACAGRQPGAHVCADDGKSVVVCGPDLVTTSVAESCGAATPACLNATCVACTPKTTQCSGNLLQTCTATGTWSSAETCAAATPSCTSGACSAPPSCSGLAANCGASGTDSCCNSPIVPGGTYNRGNDASYPATVSDFRLDKYEITVGRFKKFVAAYSQSMIPAGAGKNPNNPSDPGWDVAWNAYLPTDAAALATAVECSAKYQTWNSGNDRLPINCLSWYEAEAFCIWDGGRLPTEAEWNYAAAGGSEQRNYPWGNTEPGADATLANYNYNYPTPGGGILGVANIAPVGSAVAGNGKWGQADLAGNESEWVQDGLSNYDAPCVNCAAINTASSFRIARGGSFADDKSALLTSYRTYGAPAANESGGAARCARAR